VNNDNFSIDEILNDVRRLTGQETESEKLWSLAEIDALLGDEKKEEIQEEAAAAEPEDDGVSLRDFAKENAIDYSIDSVLENLPETDEDVEDFIGEFIDSDDEKDEPASRKTAEAKEEEFTQEIAEEIEPLLDSVEDEEVAVANEDDSEEEIDVPGQISIEKTRVFNEIDPRSETQDGIDHQIGATKIIRTGEIPVKGGMEQDPYRERFFNKPELSIEKTQEHRDLIKDLPQKTIERTGVIVKKNQFEKTSEDGLSPVPTLVDPADEYEAQRRLEMESQNGALRRNVLEDENQIMLEGFGEEEEIEIVNEEITEANLRKARREKAKNFRLFPNLLDDEIPDYEEPEDSENEEAVEDNGKTRKVTLDEEAELEGEDIDNEASEEEDIKIYEKESKPSEPVRVAREFFGPKDAHAVYDIFLKDLGKKRLKLIISVVALAALLIGAISTSFFDSFVLFGSSVTVYSTVNLLILLAVAAFNYDAFADAVQKAKKKKLTSSGALSLSLIIGIIQSAVSFAFPDLVAGGTHLYAAVAVFPVMMINLADYIKVKTDLDNFLLINSNREGFWAAKSVDDEGVAFEIGRGLMIKEPDVRYSSKVNFPYKFVEMTKAVDPTAEIYKLVIPVAAIAAGIVGIISCIINKSLFVGITSLTGVFLMGMPCAIGVALFGLLMTANRKLNSDGSLISGYEAVNNSLEANAVAIDAHDLFRNGNANIYGIKLFNSMRIDEAILYTAAVVMQSDGALSEVFNSIILSNDDMLPPVDSLAYEEKLGCSGWIYNYRVLVGNRDLLLKHNVEVQSKQDEAKYTAGGRQVIYLAVEGKVSAMFVVGYSVDGDMSKLLRSLEKAGISVLVRTSDPNITDELVEQAFSLPRGCVKVISPVAGVMYKELTETEAENEPCRILHNGKVNSFLSSFVTALSLNEKSKMITVLQYIGVAIGILLMAMFSFTSGVSQAGAFQIILFEAIWSAVVVFAPQLKR